jgi:hypothetical protein
MLRSGRCSCGVCVVCVWWVGERVIGIDAELTDTGMDGKEELNGASGSAVEMGCGRRFEEAV